MMNVSFRNGGLLYAGSGARKISERDQFTPCRKVLRSAVPILAARLSSLTSLFHLLFFHLSYLRLKYFHLLHWTSLVLFRLFEYFSFCLNVAWSLLYSFRSFGGRRWGFDGYQLKASVILNPTINIILFNLGFIFISPRIICFGFYAVLLAPLLNAQTARFLFFDLSFPLLHSDILL